MIPIFNKTLNGNYCKEVRTSHLRYSGSFIFYHVNPISSINNFVCLYDYEQKLLVFFTTQEVYDKEQLRNEINDFLNDHEFPILTNDSTYKVISINQLLNAVGFSYDDLKQFQFKIKNSDKRILFRLLKIDAKNHSYYNFDISCDEFLKTFVGSFKKITANLIEFKRSNIQTALNLHTYLLQYDIHNLNSMKMTAISPKLKPNDFSKLTTLNKNLNIEELNQQNEIPDDITNYVNSLFSFIATLDPVKIQKQPSSTYFKLALSGLIIEIKYNFIKQSKKVNNYIYIKIPGFTSLMLSKEMLCAFLNLIDSEMKDLLINKLEIFKLKYI